MSRLDSRRSGRSDARSRPHQRGGGTASVASERGVSGGRFLPPDPSVEQPYLFTPTMAFRLAILAGIALLVFGVLTLRLWSLQILSGDKYRQAALENQDRLVRIEPPRGTILDRNGRPLVQNVASTSVQIWPADLPKDRAVREAELLELSRTLRLPVADINRAIRARGRDILTPVVVRRSVHPEQIAYLLERGRQFPGVQLKDAYIRRYPWQAMAAQVLGHVGEISADQLKARRRDGYQPGDLVGQAGVEAAYEKYLRGQDGLAVLRVDARGRPRGELRLRSQPQVGNSVRLTLDARLQRAAEHALRFGIGRARANKNWYANGGAIVALDPRDGSILAAASNPTYKPSIYAGRVDPRRLAPLADAQTAKEANYPILNRVTQGLYPPGSTFKPVTAIAALQERLLSSYQALPCTPRYEVPNPYGGPPQVFKNWNPDVGTTMTLTTALAASCDTFFYRLGDAFYNLPNDRGHPLQGWASRLGFGAPTGVELTPEEDGLLPTPEWREATYTKKTDRCCWQVDRTWKPGDSIQLAIGQKDLLVTPLQMARFYASIANGGRLVQPHLLLDVEQTAASPGVPRPLYAYRPRAGEATRVDPAALSVVRQGLYDATHASYGTSSGVFGHFPVAVAGKTGTAEKVVDVEGQARLLSQSWWCGYAPADTPTIAVCAVIENGGFGSEAAAPAALRVFQEYFDIKTVHETYVASD